MSYSFSLTTFNPSGKLLQIEYALKAVQKGQTTVGIRAKEGVVLATSKVLSSALIEAENVHKIEKISENIAMVYAGMGPDFRVLVAKARKAAAKYYHIYHENIPTVQLVRKVAAVMQEFTQSGGVRPFGVSVLIAGSDDNGPQLFQVDPSGSYFAWKACAIGKNYANAKTYLEKRYRAEFEVDDAVHNALLTLKEGFEGEMTDSNIEVAKIGKDGKVHVFSTSEMRDYLEEAE
eukprot:g3871.t1